MVRTSPCFYIAPTAISVSPNANGSASDIAVNVVRGAKIKVYSPGVPALGYSDVSFQQWTLTGRNRRLADNTKPYSIYARLAKSNKEDGYLVFAPKVASGTEWLDKYAYVTVGGLATGTANKNSEDYWYVKLGEVSLPTNNARTVTLDTGILGTDKFNTDWNIDPDQMPLRIELSATIESKDAGDRPYVEWGKRLVLQAKLLEGWANANVQRFSHFTIQRNTGNASADTAYNYPDEKSNSERPSSGRQMPNGLIVLSHARGSGDVFDGTVSSTWTVIAWGIKANTTNSTSSKSASSKDVLSSSSSTNGVATADQYEMLAEKSINIMAETVEQYTLELSASVVNYDPGSDTYTPANGVDAMVRAIDQKGEVFKLTKAQLEAANLVVQYNSIANLDQWNDCKVTSATTDVAKANVPIEAFRLQQNVNVRLVKAQSTSVSTSSASSTSSTEVSKTTYKEIYRSHIALIRNGEDSKEREWIFLRSTVELSFAATADDNHKLLPSLIKGGEVKPKEAAAGTDTNKNQDGWVPQGWWDDSLGTNETYLYEYTAYRDYIKGNTSDSSSSGDAAQRGGHWGDFSTPRIWSHYGKDAVTYGVQLSSTYETWNDAKKHAGIKVTYTKTTGTTVSNYGNVQVLGTAKVYADGTEIKDASDHLNSGYNRIIFDMYTFDGNNNTPSIGTASVITVELLVGGTVVATANYSNGKQGDGVVMAYKHADTQPDAPTGTDPEYPGDGWSLSPDATTAGEKVTGVSYGGYESGTYDGTNKGTDATAKEWTEAEDDGRTWMKSPSGLGDNYGYALMKMSFTTQYDNTTVDVEIKAYSEQNYDLVEVWALDTAPDTGTTFRGQGLAHASGNGVEQAYSFTVAKAGRHFICVTYAKDISGNDNGDYGLFRLDLSGNEVAVSDTVWMSQAKVSGGKCVLPWSTPVKINGADGIGAFEILCDPETIVIDTDDYGLATGLDNASASLMCLRDGKEMSGVTYKKGLCMNCGATVNTDTGVVTITSVREQSVTVDGQTVKVSCTSGSVTVFVTDPTTKTTYVKTIPFSVNVAKFNGGLKADNKRLKSQYSELSKNSATKDDLKQYDSKIEQTARNISLKVMEKSVSRRNLLPGSAFRKQGEGCSIVQDGQDAINGICINGGYDGVNCARLRNEGDAGAAFPRVSWDGGRNSNIKVAKGKKYTLSFWAKRLSSTEGGYEISTQFFLQNGANGSDRPYHALKKGSFTVESQGAWEFIQDTVTIPSDAKSNYMEVCICLALSKSGMAEILVCRPMLEEGEEYNGWTLSEQDYDYVGGNLLDGTATLAKTGNVEVLDGTVTQGGMGESASIKAVLPPTVKEVDFLQYSTSGMGLKANEDYTLSFYAKTEGNAGKLQCYLYPSDGGINTEDSEGGYDYYTPKDGSLRSEIVPGTRWKRYWVHWRPTKADPEHVLFRLMRGGNDRGTYSSYTTYAVDDVVLYDGTYYRCIMAGQGNTPSSSPSYWDATKYGISLSQPKLEVGATMTEWTAKRADMVDKQALYATGIDIKNRKIFATADNFVVRNNSGDRTFSIDKDGNIVGSGGASFNGPMKATTFTLNSTYFSVKEDGTITAKGGQISFFYFDAEGMASAVEYDSSQNKPWRGIGLSSDNISVSGYTGQRISSVFLGKGLIDSRFAGSDKNYIVHRVGTTSSASTFYNYIKLERFKDGHDSYENDPEYAALGIETQGDFCLAALGGPSLFAGMCFASNTVGDRFTADKRHCFYLCSGGTFNMPSDPPDGMLIVVIQTGSRINFNGNGHSFRSGTNYSESCNSNSAGQWNLFYYDGSNWNTVYMNGRPW